LISDDCYKFWSTRLPILTRSLSQYICPYSWINKSMKVMKSSLLIILEINLVNKYRSYNWIVKYPQTTYDLEYLLLILNQQTHPYSNNRIRGKSRKYSQSIIQKSSVSSELYSRSYEKNINFRSTPTLTQSISIHVLVNQSIDEATSYLNHPQNLKEFQSK